MRETLRKANIKLEEFQDKLKNTISEVRCRDIYKTVED